MKLSPLIETDRPKINEWLANPMIQYYLVTEKINPELDIVSFGIHSSNGELIGWANLQNIDYENSKAEFGIAIPDLKHIKLGGFACKQVIEYGFKVLGLHRIYVRPLLSNIKPYPDDIRDKGGFVREGIERQAVKRGSAYEDVVVMSILKEEFEQRWC